MSLAHYQKYKESDNEWLGDVPAGWGLVPMKTVATCNDDVLSESTDELYSIEYVEISDIDSYSGITKTSALQFGEAPSRARRIIKHGDILVSTVRTYLRAIAAVDNPPDNLIASTGFAVIRPRRIESGFLGYLFQAEYLVSKIISYSVGVSYPAINASELMRFGIPFPPLEEQQAIAAFLDAETARIDALIAEYETLIELLKEKRQALISQAVTKGLNPDVPMKDSGVEWLGEVPEGWKPIPLHSMSSDSNSLFIDGDWIESKDLSDTGIRYITTGNVGEGFYKEQGAGFISEETFVDLRCTKVKPGDILISHLNIPIGRSCIIPEFFGYMVTSVDNVIFRPDRDFSRQFITYMLSSKAHLANMENLARGTTMQRISRSTLGSAKFCMPPPEEQHAIVAFLDAETARMDTLVQEAENGINLLRERRMTLISDAVTGKIDVRDWKETM